MSQLEIRWPSSRIYEALKSDFGEALRDEIQAFCLRQTGGDIAKTKKLSNKNKLHNLFGQNLRDAMCKLCPQTLEDLDYYLANCGLRTNIKKNYGDFIIKYFNEYLNKHPDLALKGEHPKMSKKEHDELNEVSYFDASSKKKKKKKPTKATNKKRKMEKENVGNAVVKRSKNDNKSTATYIDDDDDDDDDDFMNDGDDDVAVTKMMDQMESNNQGQGRRHSTVDLT